VNEHVTSQYGPDAVITNAKTSFRYVMLYTRYIQQCICYGMLIMGSM